MDNFLQAGVLNSILSFPLPPNPSSYPPTPTPSSPPPRPPPAALPLSSPPSSLLPSNAPPPLLALSPRHCAFTLTVRVLSSASRGRRWVRGKPGGAGPCSASYGGGAGGWGG